MTAQSGGKLEPRVSILPYGEAFVFDGQPVIVNGDMYYCGCDEPRPVHPDLPLIDDCTHAAAVRRVREARLRGRV